MKDAMPLEKAEVATELPPVKDYYKWACEQAALIRAGRFDQIDALNVADEIEDVGKSELGALASNIEIIIVHILKWNYQPSRRSRSWSNSIAEHRRRVIRVLRENPGFQTKRDEVISGAHEFARFVAARQTRLVLSRFPETCPSSWSDIMDRPFEINDRD